MGERAVLVIDGHLRTLSPGGVERGVRFIGLQGGEAQVEFDGRRALLRLGAGPLAIAEAQGGGGSQIVLPAGLGGHFTTSGSINGKPVEFIVDTGATAVSMSQADAERIGLPYRNGRRGLTQTANGAIPVNFVTLDSVRIGDVEVYNVQAAVVPAPMSHVLLGNSFHTRFQMKRENDTLTLEKRP
jgi:aspartyl protease family protein